MIGFLWSPAICVISANPASRRGMWTDFKTMPADRTLRRVSGRNNQHNTRIRSEWNISGVVCNQRSDSRRLGRRGISLGRGAGRRW